MRITWGILILGACAHTVPQDLATGGDGKPKGARPIALENGEGKAKGIVTYPGGDRVDWRLIELPDGKRGTLDMKLTWKAPRPGLQVAFDVFDRYNQPIVATKASLSRRGRSRSAQIEHARGTYFVRIYAPRRGDAGAYNLVASFAEDPQPVITDPRAVEIPEPPRLAAVPPPDPVCDPFELGNPVCKKQCDVTAPQGWPGCGPGTPQYTGPVITPPPPPPPVVVASPVNARIIKVEVVADGVLVTIAAGTDQGIDKTWRGAVLGHDTNSPLAAGAVRIIRVGKLQTIAKVQLTTDIVNQNPLVRLSPP